MQEVIVQNFRAKPGTRMAGTPRAVPRRPPLDDRGRPDPARPDVARAGAAEPRLRRLPAAPRRRHRRLGRRLAGDDRPREPRGAVAGDRAARGGDALARARARAAAAALPRVRRRSRALGRSGTSRRTSGALPTRAGSRATTRGRPASRAACRSSSGATRCRSSSSEPSSARTRSRVSSRRVGRRPQRVLRCRRPTSAATSAATRSPTSSRGTSSTRTSATSAAASAPSRRGSSREPARRALPRPARGDRPPHARRRGTAARPRSASRAGSIPAFTGDYYADVVACDQGRRARHPRARVLGARDLAGRGDARALARGATSRGSATSASARSPARPPRSSTTRCGRSSAPTR